MSSSWAEPMPFWQKAKQSFDKGDYRWVAQVVNHVVFADPNNKQARDLQADALEQLGYQAESGPWRNFYLTGAKELREGVKKLPTPNTASPDTVRAMTPEMFFDYLSVRVDRTKAGDAKMALNFDFGNSGGKYLVELENGVLNHTEDRPGQQCRRDGDPDARHAEQDHPPGDEAGGCDQRRGRQGQRQSGEAERDGVVSRQLRVLVQHRHAIGMRGNTLLGPACMSGTRPSMDFLRRTGSRLWVMQ